MKLLAITFAFLLLNAAHRSVAAPPSIPYPPKAETVPLYHQAVFGVIAKGTLPLSYQWRKNGIAIPGATNDQLLFRQTRFGDEGQYSVLVSNAEGSVSSPEVSLAVRLPSAGDLHSSLGVAGSFRWVSAAAVQPDGKVLIGGSFKSIYGKAAEGVARLNKDGTTDFTFTNVVGASEVDALILQDDGKVLISGDFTNVHGVVRNRIARLNADGTLDDSFQATLPIGMSSVECMALQKEGKVLITGRPSPTDYFTRQLVRLNSDGTLDSSFNSLPKTDYEISTVLVQEDEKILIGGYFNTINGTIRRRIARLNPDGTLDPTFDSDVSGAVLALSTSARGKILIGGYLRSIGGISRTNIAQLNSDGTLDTHFAAQLSGARSDVISIAVQNDGKILVGASGDAPPTIVRLNPDGTFDPAFVVGTIGADFGPDVAININTINIQSDGKIVVGGGFSPDEGAPRSGIARLNPDGTLDDSFENPMGGLNGAVLAMVTQGEQLLLAGSFRRFRGSVIPGLQRVTPGGNLDPTFEPPEIVGTVVTLAAHEDRGIVIGGGFRTVNGIGRTNIARLKADGSLDETFLQGLAGANDRVNIAVLQSDQKILIGGKFSEVNGVARGRLARLHPDGSLDTSFLAGLPGLAGGVDWDWYNGVTSILVQQDNKVVAGGDFTMANGVPRSGIARLNADGTLDTNFMASIGGPNARIRSMALDSIGRIIVCGAFTSVNGVSRNGIARLNEDGSLDSSFQDVPSFANRTNSTVLVDSQGRIYVGGGPKNLVRLNQDGTIDESFRCDADDAVLCSTFQPDDTLVVGGAFEVLNGQSVAKFARIWTDAPSFIEGLTSSQDTDAVLSLRLPAGTTNRVQYKTELSSSTWTDLPGDIVAESELSTNKVDTTGGAGSQRFYRVRQVP